MPSDTPSLADYFRASDEYDESTLEDIPEWIQEAIDDELAEIAE